MTTVSRALSRGRTSTAGCLFVLGALTGSWTSRIPLIKHDLTLTTSELSVALVGVPAGLLIAMRIIPGLVARCSSGFVIRAAITLMSLSLVGLGLMWDLPSLTVCLVSFGVASGAMDVAVNVQATAVERGYGRSVMSRLHAMFSAGLLLAALAGSLTLKLGVSSVGFFLVMATLLGTIGLLFSRALLGDAADAIVGDSSTGPVTVADGRLTRQPRLMAAGVIAFSGLFAEGAVNDWAGVFLHQVRHMSFSVAALGAAGFGVGMALGRFGGDAIIARAGRRSTLTAAAVSAAVAFSAAILIPVGAASIAAFGVLGLVLATIIPNAFSLAGGVIGLPPAWAISRVTTIGYLGAFSSPAVIGFVAAGAGLTTAMLLPAVLLLLVLPAGWVAAR